MPFLSVLCSLCRLCWNAPEYLLFILRRPTSGCDRPTLKLLKEFNYWSSSVLLCKGNPGAFWRLFPQKYILDVWSYEGNFEFFIRFFEMLLKKCPYSCEQFICRNIDSGTNWFLRITKVGGRCTVLGDWECRRFLAVPQESGELRSRTSPMCIWITVICR